MKDDTDEQSNARFTVDLTVVTAHRTYFTRQCVAPSNYCHWSLFIPYIHKYYKHMFEY